MLNATTGPGLPAAALSRLSGVRRMGGYWMARCPAHEDRAPSLSLRPVDDRLLANCFAGCDISDIRAAIGDNLPANFRLPPPPPPKPCLWKPHAERIVAGYCQAPDRYQRWADYKDVRRATVDAWQLGVGVLPETSCPHRRLVVPVRRNGVVVALAGRELGCGCEAKYGTKWVNARGSEGRLFNEEGLKAGAKVVITENRVDALLVMDEWPDVVAVALGSAHARPEWIVQIAESQPRRVVVWLDNDLAGCPSNRIFWAYLDKCRAEGTKPKQPGGSALISELRRLGVNAEAFRWKDDDDAKRDAGQEIAKLRLERRSA